MDLLGQFGFNLVVIPHWNNAEGGTHDTRFCFMGTPRFRKLEALLPRNVSILGLDEHTACIICLESNVAEIKGIGRAILRQYKGEVTFNTGDRFPLDILRGRNIDSGWKSAAPQAKSPESDSEGREGSFWQRIHALEASFRKGLENRDPHKSTNALLDLDRTIWQAQQDMEPEEFIAQARDTLRELMVLLGTRLSDSPGNKKECLASLVGALLELRQQFRQKKQWQNADAIRESLQRSGIMAEDTADGPRWRLIP
jgi:hypothetical protein